MNLSFDQLITFSRTSAATYVNSAGNVVQTPASKNLLLWTEGFDNAAWSKTNVTITGNNVVGPDGRSTADTLTDDATSGQHRIAHGSFGSGSTHTFSIYAKAGTHSFIQLICTGGGGTNAWFTAIANLATGAITQTGNGASGTLASSSITAIGNGWYRISISGSIASGTAATRVGPAPSATGNSLGSSDGSITYAGTGTTLHLWGAQLELGSAVTSYVKNDGGLFPARFDYDPATLAPKGLLIESQRTNLLLWSEEFDNASWTKTRSTVTANASVSPDGTMDADKLVEDTTATATHRTFQQATKAASSLTRTFSVYLKASERTFARVQVSDSTEVVVARTDIDLSAGTATAASIAGGSSISAASARISPAGNGWYRVELTATFDETITVPGAFVFLCNSLSGISYTGDGASGIFVWGAQWEDGSYATSYIPTAGSQVTRTADQASIVAPNFAPWYNQSEGTFVVEADGNSPALTNVMNLFAAGDGSANNYIRAFHYNGKWGTNGVVGGTAQWDLQAVASYTVGGAAKIAIAYKVNDVAVSVGGATSLTDTSAAIPTVDRLSLGQSPAGGAFYLDGHIRSVKYFPSRISNAQLQALSA